MEEQDGVPLDELVAHYKLTVTPELARVKALALQVQQHRAATAHATQGLVSRTSLLHACGLIQPPVFARLTEGGLDRASWEETIGVQGASFEAPPEASSDVPVYVRPRDMTRVLERYTGEFQSRDLDALGLAWAIAAEPEAGVAQRLRRAGASWDTVEPLLAEDVASSIGLVPLAGLDRYRFTPVVEKALERAKALASERPQGTPLTASLLLLGLVEHGAGTTLLDTAALLRSKLLDPHPDTYASTVDDYLSWYGERRTEERQPRWMTRRVGEIFARALRLSQETRRRSLINARSLLGAILAYHTPEGGSRLGAHLLLEALGSSVEAMTVALLDFLRTNAPSEGGDNLEAWEDFFLSADRDGGPANVARVDAEGLGGKDLLRLDNDIMAFALLLASANLTPPLAIGLFGNWGAGKSFFMKKLAERIQSLASTAEERRARNEPTPLHGQIVQIELNAWHYEETNLWASMVTHIFESLHRHFEPREQEEKKRWAELLKQLSEADRSRDRDQTVLDQAVSDLKKAREEHADKKTKLGNVVNAAWATIRESLSAEDRKALEEALAVPELDALKEDLLLRRKEALELKDRTALLRQSVVRMLGKPSTLLAPAAVLALSLAALALLPALFPFLQSDAAQRALATVTEVLALAGGVSSWLGTAFHKASGILDTIDRLQKTVQETLEGTETAGRLREAEAAVTLARRRLAEQEAQVARLRAEVEENRPGRRLLRFLEDRAGSSDYRKHLGLPALVRRDFEQLQKLLDQEILLDRPAAPDALGDAAILARLREAIQQDDVPLDSSAAIRQVETGWVVDDPKNKRLIRIQKPEADSGQLRCRVVWTNLPRVDRIILYIDDLDRCPPGRVVEVLRAIQLLLAFPLFVVVVGVDARWVKRSLNIRYRSQFRPLVGHEWDGATPLDYIEKIFQIPFWLEPLTSTSTRRYLEGLLSASPAPARRGASAPPAGYAGKTSGGVEGQETTEPEESGATGTTGEPGATGSRPAAAAAAGSAPGAAAALPTAGSTRIAAAAGESLPDLLEIEPLEQDFMLALAPVVRRTPRSVKRFVNIYRLYRASRAKGRLNAFLGTSDTPGPFREALLLLALLTAAPDLAPDIFLYLRHAAGPTLQDALAGIDASAETFSTPAWSLIAADLKDLLDTLAADGATPLTLEALREQLSDASRYSFLEMPTL